MSKDTGDKTRQLIARIGLSSRDLLDLRRLYTSDNKKGDASDARSKTHKNFLNYIIFMSQQCWRGTTLAGLFALSFALYDFYKNRAAESAAIIFLLLAIILLFCVIKANGDLFGLRFKTAVKLFVLRFLHRFYG
ncbi:hypothetical protein GWD52_10470 [Enterobacteriaceae bacterium 4M9]|nr:hypothetical protein [Enterobacteriaceae bacterium 4M9]